MLRYKRYKSICERHRDDTEGPYPALVNASEGRYIHEHRNRIEHERMVQIIAFDDTSALACVSCCRGLYRNRRIDRNSTPIGSNRLSCRQRLSIMMVSYSRIASNASWLSAVFGSTKGDASCIS